MGDTNVDIFLETLERLSNLRFITYDQKDRLLSLKEEIKYLREFLMTTEKKRNEHSNVMKLVMKIRDVVSEAENIVELFVSHKLEAMYPSPFGDVNKKKSTENKMKKQSDLRYLLDSVKKKIKTLTAEVEKIYNANMYDINEAAVKKLMHSSSGSGGSSVGSNASKIIEEKVVVGFKEDVETLLKKLCDSGEGGQLEIISIVGVGGGGKTTLAREVYDHRLTSHTFEIRAWVDVSQDYDKTMKRDLLIRILELVSPGKHEDSEDKLGEEIHKCLKGRKYLIIMDDIWDIEVWNDIQRSFPKEGKGSKVLFTSRKLIQPDSISSISHDLALLPKSCSWELLQKKVFGKKRCPPELMSIGEQIAEKCEGLPLGIVAIAGILAMKDKTIDVWEEVAKHLSSIIAKKEMGCMEILELSYNHLPLHLKACFLYIGAYPEDCEIPIHELIWLWIAEGFIQQSEGEKSLEDVAEDYLMGLIDRSLVMVARKSKSHGGIKACRIHDLLRELCLKKIEEDNFLVRIFRKDSISCSATIRQRRLFIGHQFFQKFSSRPHDQNLHSFVCLSLPNSSTLPNSTDWTQLSFFIKNFKLLRVLHFVSTKTTGVIPTGDLFYLRYLALEHKHNQSQFPFWSYFFLSLPNLETLNLQVPLFTKISLPSSMVKMVKLRHLYSKWGIFQFHYVSPDIENGNKLDSLQTLQNMCICHKCQPFLRMTPNLRKLGLDGGECFQMLHNLMFLERLEILKVHRACMDNTGLKLPPTLTRLTLINTYLKWDTLSIILQTLPSLEVLKLLYESCSGPVWNTSDLKEGFSKLKYLRLEHLDIEEWNACEDQFPLIEVLEIKDCKKLKGIPIDFGNLNELREIKVERSSLSAEKLAKKILKKQRNKKGDDDCLSLVLQYNQG